MQIQFTQVTEVYNGRSGCMCGCNGTYVVPSHSPNPDRKTSDRSVNIALRKVNEALEQFGHLPRTQQEAKGLYFDPLYANVSVDDGNRNTTVYYKPV